MTTTRDHYVPVWRPHQPVPVQLSAADPWRLEVEGAGGHRFSLDVACAALEDRAVAAALYRATADGLHPTCEPWRVRALLQRHVLDVVKDRSPAVRWPHAEDCPACPQEGRCPCSIDTWRRS